MRKIIEKVFSLIILIIMILNSSTLTTISMAIDDVNAMTNEEVTSGKEEKVKLYSSYGKLTNRLPNELTITGVLEKDTENCALYEDPIVYFEFPSQIEKVVVDDIKILYDNELKLKDYTIETNDSGNQVIKVSLEGKQTQYSLDGISEGTNIRIVTKVIAKQDIETGYADLKFKCNTASALYGVLIVNANDNSILNNVEPKKDDSTIVYANGLMISTKSSIGTNVLKNTDTIHSNEIIDNQITITNVTNSPIENVKILGYIPDGMTFVEYDESAFSYWADTYTFLTDDPETTEGSTLWQDDDLQYPEDESVKVKEFSIESLNSGESQTFNYETKVNKLENETELETKIEFQVEEGAEYKTISTYDLKNHAKNGNFEARIRTYIDRGSNLEPDANQNNWVYNVIVKNISDSTQNAIVKINIPETLSIKNVEEIVDKEGEFTYKIEDGVLSVNYVGIAANDYRAFSIEAEAVNVITDENCRYQIEYVALVQDENGETISSNLSVSKGGIPAAKITQTSKTNGETLNGYDEVEYVFEIENIGYVREEEGGYSDYVFVTNIPKELEITSITYNSNEVTYDTIDSKVVYTITPINKYYTKEDLEKINSDDYKEEVRVRDNITLKTGEKSIITIKAKVKSLAGQTDDITIENVGVVGGDGIETKVSAIVSNTLHNNENQTIIVNPDDKDDDNNGNTEKPDDTEVKEKYYTISGTSWIDSNENGRRDDGEKIISGIDVHLYDITNKKFLTDSNDNIIKTSTDENGKYSFTKIPEGNYYVIFEYNSNEYGITEYQKVGVLETENNDTLEKNVRMFGEIKKVAMTDIITLNSSQTNIDIGLLENKNFDFSINQTIQKVIVSNKKGTKEYTYDNKKLAKVEIHSKQLAGSTIVVEYKIKVTNEGELAGRVYDVIDEIPSKLEFHSELNDGWSRTEQYKISNTSMVNKDIQPGESIELTVTLTKTLTEDSAGTITNISSIGTTDNSRHIEEKNLNNNTDKTKVLIQVATGGQIALRIIGIILGGLLVLVILYIICKKMKISKKIITTLFGIIVFITVCSVVTTYSKAGIIGDIIDAITGGSSGGGASGNGTGSDIKADGTIDPSYSPGNGESAEELEKRHMEELQTQYPGDYSGCTTLKECEERATAIIQTESANNQLAAYGKSIGPCNTPEEVQRAVDEAKREILSENYPGIDFTGVANYEEALAIYNKKCEEERANLSNILNTSSLFKNCKLDGDLSNLDYNALKDLEAGMNNLVKTYPEKKQFKGDPTSHYYSDKNGNRISDSKYWSLSEAEQKRYSGHFDRYLDENGKSVAYCASPGLAQTSKKYTDYKRTVSDLKMTVDENGKAHWDCYVKYSPTEKYCGHSVQQMDYHLGDDAYSKKLPSNVKVPDVDFPKQDIPEIPEPSTPEPEPEPIPSKTRLVIWKYDVDTNEELWKNDNSSISSEFRFRLPGYAEDFGIGEEIIVDQNKTYTIYEISSAFGYDIYDEDGNYKTFEVTVGEYMTSMNVRLNNALTKLKLSGNVWEDGLNGKDNARNDLYKDNDFDDKDKLLQGIKVKLYKDEELVGETWTDENGHYSFGGRNEDLTYTKDTINVADLDKYHVEFEYNGVKYTNVNLHTDVENGSKAIEGDNNRQNYNNKFTTIASNTIKDENENSTGKALNENSTEIGTLYYRANQKHQSSIIYGDQSIYDGTSVSGKATDFEAYGYDIYHMNADTRVDEASYRYKLEDLFDWDVNNQVYKDKEIKNVNLGLYVREQVDVAIDSDVARLALNVNGYQHTYKYGTLISDNDMNVDPNSVEQVDAKLKALKGKYYERQLHESSISYSATPEGTPNLYADITYKIYLQNKSSSLTAKIKELTLNYDTDLRIISYGYENSGTTQEVSEQQIVVNTTNGGTENLKEAVVDLEKLEDKKIFAGKKEVLEVTFRADADVIAKILNTDGIKFDVMFEVSKYSTYTQQMTAYASIDKNSAARNAQVQIDTDDSFVTDTFENDTTIAPTFKLSKGTQTELSGIVYEDSPKESTPIKIDGNDIYERVGDGVYNNENVVANVLVEILSVPKNENGQYDSDQARTLENGQQAYDVAKLYQSAKTTQGQTSNVLARTYTNDKGEYKFEGLTAGDYVIKFTYGKNMKDVDENGNDKETIRKATTIYDQNGKALKEIEAREYKSTVITSGDISNAMNITDGKGHLNGDYSWFLKSPETRYSDAVDDVEYRANLEKDAKINYEILKGTKTYVYENMEAYTPYFKLGVEEFNDQQSGATLETQEDGTLNYVFTIDNVDFGIIERPIVDLQVDKVITGLKVSLGNGQVLINGDPSKESLPYVRTGLDDFVPIEMDTELLQNATIEEEYTINVTNNSELDYSIYPIWSTDDNQKVALRRNYYYYGTQEGLTTDEAATTRIDVLGDYLGAELTADEDTMTSDGWNKMAIEELTSYNGTNLFSTENDGKKEKTLRDGKYTIYTTNTFNNPNEELVTIGQTRSIAYKVSKLLAVNTDSMKYTNDIEILQYSGYSQNKNRAENTYHRVSDTTPGNLMPGGAKEDDEDSVRTTITPPTGTIISRWLYITTAVAGLILVGVAIIFIRKRILEK